jgi:hypothetical protein
MVLVELMYCGSIIVNNPLSDWTSLYMVSRLQAIRTRDSSDTAIIILRMIGVFYVDANIIYLSLSIFDFS